VRCQSDSRLRVPLLIKQAPDAVFAPGKIAQAMRQNRPKPAPCMNCMIFCEKAIPSAPRR